MDYLKGSCLCAKIQIQIPDSFDFAGNCHCSECRKFSGSAFASAAGIEFADLKFIQGEEFVTYYHKSEETDLAFCSNCGSSLFSNKSKTGKANIRLGIFDDVPVQHPTFHIFVGTKAPWYEITDDLVQFDELPSIS